MKVIEVNRTCKVTKVNALRSNVVNTCYRHILSYNSVFLFSGGQIGKYRALLATGNYHAVVTQG